MRSTPIPGHLNAALEHHDQLPGRRLRSVGVPDAAPHVEVRRVGAGRLERSAARLTLNLGLRYDLIWNAFAQNVEFPPFEMADRPQDANNFQPRVGFAYQLTDRTVLRGGTGLYYNDILNTNVLWPQSPLTIAVIRVNNDGRPDFASNPFNGPLPTYEQALQRFCNVNNRPGCLLRDLQEQAPIPDYAACDAQLADVDRRRSTSSGRARRSTSTTSTPGAATRSRSRTTSTSRSTRLPAIHIRIRTSRDARSRPTGWSE